MNYTRSSFSVPAIGTKEYRDAWDRTFGKKEKEVKEEEKPKLVIKECKDVSTK